jgi:hypothetical protein
MIKTVALIYFFRVVHFITNNLDCYKVVSFEKRGLTTYIVAVYEGEPKMKSVIISIQPSWCRLILEGKKTVEVRKTKPQIKLPFKCYIYCTRSGERYTVPVYENGKMAGHETKNGMVVGEFICDKIMPIRDYMDGVVDAVVRQTTCMTPRDFMAYGKGETLYGWNITNLVIYDDPEWVDSFFVKCDEDCSTSCEHWKYTRVNFSEYDMECSTGRFGYKPLKRAPQSWCYVEDPEGDIKGK